VCPNCREGYIPSDEELEELELPREKLNGGMIYHGKGCDTCFGSGYKGRHGIYELLPIDSTLQTHIARKADATELRRIALEEGMVSLRKHGAHLIRSGVTTLSEVMRMTRRH